MFRRINQTCRGDRTLSKLIDEVSVLVLCTLGAPESTNAEPAKSFYTYGVNIDLPKPFSRQFLVNGRSY